MGEWLEKTLGELTSFIAKGIPPRYADKSGNETIRVLNQKCNRNNRILYSESRLHDNREKKVPNSKMLKDLDVLINSTGTGTAGRVAQIWHVPEPTTIDGHMILMRPTQEIDPLYYGYVIKTFQKQIEGFAEGSTGQTEINKRRLQDEIIVRFPVSLDEQNAMGRMLKAIDEKIQNNEDINDNLAYQNQAILYNFMEKYPYHLQPLSDIAIVIDCLHSKKPSFVENSEYQLIQLDNIKDDGFLDMSSCQYMISHEDYVNWTRRCEIVEGDCVITNVGRIGAVSQAPYGTKAAMGRNMTCLRLKPEAKLHAYFITVLLSQHMRRQILQNTDEGTILGALNVKNIPKLLFPIFESSVLSQLEETLFPLRKQIEFNSLQNQKLTQLRDSLLPKLMSGELNVSNIEI